MTLKQHKDRLRYGSNQTREQILADWNADRETLLRAPPLLPLVRELEDALRLMFAAIPEDWPVPLLYPYIVGQCKEVMARVDKQLADAASESQEGEEERV